MRDLAPTQLVVITRDELVELIDKAVAEAVARAFDERTAGGDEYVSVLEAAELLDVHVNTVRRYVRIGRLLGSRATSRGSSRVRISKASVEALQKRQ